METPPVTAPVPGIAAGLLHLLFPPRISQKSKEKREFSLKISSTRRLKSLQFWLFFKDLKVNTVTLGIVQQFNITILRGIFPKGFRSAVPPFSSLGSKQLTDWIDAVEGSESPQ
ncbi:MAG: hypothetical protein LBH57_09245 [Treponema sp.]|nr:hypothetical protein [Treponema sp.]